MTAQREPEFKVHAGAAEAVAGRSQGARHVTPEELQRRKLANERVEHYARLFAGSGHSPVDLIRSARHELEERVERSVNRSTKPASG
jgi:hypothetical protein